MVYSLRFSLVVIKERRYPQNGRWVAQQNGSSGGIVAYGILYVVKFEFFKLHFEAAEVKFLEIL